MTELNQANFDALLAQFDQFKDALKVKDKTVVQLERELDDTRAQATAATVTAASVSSVQAVTLPPFWTEESTLWFARCEAQFRTKNVTREVTKFHNVVSMIDTKTASLVSDLITVTPL